MLYLPAPRENDVIDSQMCPEVSAGSPKVIEARKTEKAKRVCHIKTVHTQDKLITITDEVYCPDVPGGVIAHTSKTTDQAGDIVRRSTLELIDYAIGDKSSGSRRPGRRKKPLP